jgi:hypothetical protein
VGQRRHPDQQHLGQQIIRPEAQTNLASCPPGRGARLPEVTACEVQRAPFKVHDVEHVTLLPWSHLMQTAMHCSSDLGLNGL